MKKILITGATGFIGSHVVDLLVSRGEPARALVSSGEDPQRLTRQGVEICPGDLKDRASLAEAVQGISCVIHCAARTGPWGPQSEYEAVNVHGFEDLLQLALKAGVERFVHVSSIIVHGADLGGVADEAAPMRIEPHNPYSWSKVMAERLAQTYIREQKAPITIVRPGWVYGPRDTGSFARFAAMVKNQRMILMGSGNNHVPLVYVSDVAEGIYLASQKEQAAGKAYLLVNDEEVTQKEYFTTIAAGLGVPAPKLRIPYRLALMAGSSAEASYHLLKRSSPPPLTRYGVQLLGGENRFQISKTRQELGFQPQVNVHQGVMQSIAWIREKE